jgi:hypothetical protein
MDHAGIMKSWTIKKRKLVIINQRGNNLTNGFFHRKIAMIEKASTIFRKIDA